MFDPFRPDLLTGKTTIITGGGTGLGRSMALRLAGLGARVAVLGRRPEPLPGDGPCDPRGGRQVAGGVPLRRARSRRGQGRVRRGGDRARPREPARQQRGRQLPVSHRGPSPNAFHSVVQIVLYGSFHCTTEIGRRLIARKERGEVLAITTTYAATGSAFVVPSAVAKAGVRALVKSLAVEWAAYGIRLNAIAPGPFPTDGAFSRLMPGSDLEKQALARIPWRRFGEHWELTNLVAYLLSDASPYQTGDEVTIDGAEALLSGQQFASFVRMDRDAAKQMMAAMKPKK